MCHLSVVSFCFTGCVSMFYCCILVSLEFPCALLMKWLRKRHERLLHNRRAHIFFMSQLIKDNPRIWDDFCLFYRLISSNLEMWGKFFLEKYKKFLKTRFSCFFLRFIKFLPWNIKSFLVLELQNFISLNIRNIFRVVFFSVFELIKFLI